MNMDFFFFLKKLKEFNDLLKKKKKLVIEIPGCRNFFLGSNTAPLVVNVLLEDGFSGS